jgi:hypothetical protein
MALPAAELARRAVARGRPFAGPVLLIAGLVGVAYWANSTWRPAGWFWAGFIAVVVCGVVPGIKDIVRELASKLVAWTAGACRWIGVGLVRVAEFLHVQRPCRWVGAELTALGAGLRPLLRPLSQLWQVLAPLVLFVIVVSIFTVGGLTWWLELLAGVGSAVVVLRVFRLEWHDDVRMAHLRRGGEHWVALLAILGFCAGVATVVVLLTWLVWTDGADYIQRRGGASTWVAYGALVLVACMLLARLVAFSSAPVPGLLATLMVLIAIHALMVIGAVPGYDYGAAQVPLWVDLALFAFVLGALVGQWPADLRDQVRPVPTGTWRATSNRVGFLLAFVGSIVFVVAVGLGGLVTRESGSHQDYAGEVRAGLPSVPPRQMTDRQLANTFAPVLRLTKDELWQPSDVTHFLHAAKLIPLEGKGLGLVRYSPTLSDLPVGCPESNDEPCYELTCIQGDGACAAGHTRDAGRYAAGVTYARVYRARSGTHFDARNPFGKDLTAVVEYWLYYRYDLWKSLTLVGTLRQQHESDWEAVIVGLSDTKPLFVGYTAHCGGVWFRWDDTKHKIEASSLVPRPDGTARETRAKSSTHPLVGVAEGSHANYRDSWEERVPDWAGCEGISSALVDSLSYVWNIRDTTSDYRTIVPQVRLLRHDTPSWPVWAFHGLWGRSDIITLGNFRHPAKVLSGPDEAPRSPSLQPLGRHPVPTIFCSKNWHPYDCNELMQ